MGVHTCLECAQSLCHSQLWIIFVSISIGNHMNDGILLIWCAVLALLQRNIRFCLIVVGVLPHRPSSAKASCNQWFCFSLHFSSSSSSSFSVVHSITNNTHCAIVGLIACGSWGTHLLSWMPLNCCALRCLSATHKTKSTRSRQPTQPQPSNIIISLLSETGIDKTFNYISHAQMAHTANAMAKIGVSTRRSCVFSVKNIDYLNVATGRQRNVCLCVACFGNMFYSKL